MYQFNQIRWELDGQVLTCVFQYLRSVRPLMDDDKYRRMEKLVDEFKNGIGNKLQRYLVLKSWWATNYVSTAYILYCFNWAQFTPVTHAFYT